MSSIWLFWLLLLVVMFQRRKGNRKENKAKKKRNAVLCNKSNHIHNIIFIRHTKNIQCQRIKKKSITKLK